MNFLNVLKVIGAILTLGATVNIEIEPCRCGSSDLVVYRIKRRWKVKCKQCGRTSVPRVFRRAAKRQWNKQSKM